MYKSIKIEITKTLKTEKRGAIKKTFVNVYVARICDQSNYYLGTLRHVVFQTCNTAFDNVFKRGEKNKKS